MRNLKNRLERIYRKAARTLVERGVEGPAPPKAPSEPPKSPQVGSHYLPWPCHKQACLSRPYHRRCCCCPLFCSSFRSSDFGEPNQLGSTALMLIPAAPDLRCHRPCTDLPSQNSSHPKPEIESRELCR